MPGPKYCQSTTRNRLPLPHHVLPTGPSHYKDNFDEVVIVRAAEGTPIHPSHDQGLSLVPEYLFALVTKKLHWVPRFESKVNFVQVQTLAHQAVLTNWKKEQTTRSDFSMIYVYLMQK